MGRKEKNLIVLNAEGKYVAEKRMIGGIRMQEVKECYNNAEIYECLRCNQSYCDNCHPPQEVDFEIIEKVEGFGGKPRVTTTEKIKWKDEKVCPYCYNQLRNLKIKQNFG